MDFTAQGCSNNGYKKETLALLLSLHNQPAQTAEKSTHTLIYISNTITTPLPSRRLSTTTKKTKVPQPSTHSLQLPIHKVQLLYPSTAYTYFHKPLNISHYGVTWSVSKLLWRSRRIRVHAYWACTDRQLRRDSRSQRRWPTVPGARAEHATNGLAIKSQEPSAGWHGQAGPKYPSGYSS